MKTRFIINPIAGTGLQKNIKEEIKKYHKDFDVLETKKSGDAKEFSLDAVKKGFNQIVAVGGDGTVNECFPPLINTPIALGIIPCGSGNGFARYLGMDTNPAVAIKQLLSCETKNIDTCSVNNMPFVNVSGVGFDAHIASLFSNLKKRGFVNYIKLIFKELSYSAKLMKLKLDNKEIEISAYMVSFANANQYGNNAIISPKSEINDGFFEIVIVNDFPKWKILFFLKKLFNGTLDNSNYVKIIKCKKIKIITSEKLIHLDGEPILISPLSPIEINISPKSLKILYPNEKKK